jgi:hypothetical protein
VSALGQTVTLSVKMAAVYALSFERAKADSLRVTLGVEDLDAQLSVPTAGSTHLDKSIVSGDLVFSVSRKGGIRVISLPKLAATGGQLLSPVGIAHSFFPGLPGTAVSTGDSWVDSVSYEDAEVSGASEHSVYRYTVAGDTVVDGRSLLAIEFSGTSELSQKTSLQGTDVAQTSSVDVHGRLLWDAASGLLYEREATTTGTGSVKAAAVPAPLPTTLETHSVARLRVE